MLVPNIREIEIDDIQLLRFWRNLEHVRSQMVVTDFIYRDDQRDWFNAIDRNYMRYFIYSLDRKDVGLVSLTKIDKKNKTFEAGIFCGDFLYLGHWINVWAVIKIYDLGFFDFSLKKSYATILKSNKIAINFNESLGYIKDSEISFKANRYFLRKSDYVKNKEKYSYYLENFIFKG